MKLKIQIVVLILSLIGITSACDTFKDEVSPESYVEMPKSLDGTWRLSTVSRNGADITKTMDFSRFILRLNKDNTYKIENYLPFVVKKEGTWKVDDPKYPFNLIFTEEGMQSDKITEIKFPVVNGVRQVSVMLSLGCSSNKYIYVFQKVAE